MKELFDPSKPPPLKIARDPVVARFQEAISNCSIEVSSKMEATEMELLYDPP